MNHPHPPVPTASSSNLPPPPTQQLSRSRSLRAIPSQVRKGLRSLSRGRSTRKPKAESEQQSSDHRPQETEGPEESRVTSDRASTTERVPNKTNTTTSEGRRDPDKKPRSSRRVKNEQQKPQQQYRRAAKEEDAKRILELMKIATSTKAGEGDRDGEKAAASRGRSRSRVRGLLLGAGGRRGSNDGTITAESSCEDGAGSPGGPPDRTEGSSAPAVARDRGRSRSRIRQLLRMGGDGSNNNNNMNKSQSRLNMSDPLGLQGSSGNVSGRQRIEPARESMRAAAALAGVPHRREEFAKLRCSVVEDLPLEYSNHSMRAVVARNASGELTDMSTLQHPPTDLLPIRSGVLAVTAAGKLLMRTVSGLGMDDPVLLGVRSNETKTGDGSLAADAHEVGDESDVSTASDRTATSEVNGGLDRTLFDELLLTLDRTAALRDAKANAWVRAVQESSPKSKPAVGETSPRHEVVTSSAVPDNLLLAPKLDPSRSSRALKSLLDQRSVSSKSKLPAAASTARNSALTRAEVEAMLAASTGAPQAPEGPQRQRRRPQSSQNGVEGGLTGFVDRDPHHVGPSGEPLRSASMHSMGGVARDGDLPPSRVVVKVRVKRRSTLDAGAPLAYRIPVASAVNPVIPSSLRRADPTRTVGQAGADNRLDADDTSTSEAYSAVQEIMSRPRLLPDMDSVFA